MRSLKNSKIWVSSLAICSLFAVALVSSNGCILTTKSDSCSNGNRCVAPPPSTTGTLPPGPNVGTVTINASSLVAPNDEKSVADLGGGRTFDQIVTARNIYAARAVMKVGQDYQFVGNDITKQNGQWVNGRIENVPAGESIEFGVYGFLYGATCQQGQEFCDYPEWAYTTCHVTPVAGQVTIAECSPLQITANIDEQGNESPRVFFATQELLPQGYCDTNKGKTDFETFRVIGQTQSGTRFNLFTPTCGGVIVIEKQILEQLETKTAQENFQSTWQLSLEVKSKTTACSIKEPYCTITRTTTATVVKSGDNNSCLVNPTSTGSNDCF